MVDFAVVPERTALVNVDMQNCFVQGYPISAPDGLALLDRINRLAAACRDAGILVIHTTHVLRPDGSNIGVLGEINPVFKQGIITKGSESATLHEKLVVDAHDILLDKPRFGAFHSTDLELILRSRGIDTVIISGIATSVCCDTTAREAMVRDFHVFFLSDGTATADMPGASAAELQKATLATLGLLFAQVLTVDEMTRKACRAYRCVLKRRTLHSCAGKNGHRSGKRQVLINSATFITHMSRKSPTRSPAGFPGLVSSK